MSLPDVSVSRMRSDFEKIFNMHKYSCTRVAYADAQAGDFFDIDGATTTTTTSIDVSIQGSSDDISRLVQGIEIPKGKVVCYVKHTTTLNPTDLIKIGDKYFKINNLYDSIKNGDVIFKQFNLEYSSNRGP
jgi:hypothetical protein